MRTDFAFIGFIAFVSTHDPQGQKQHMDAQLHVDGHVCKQRCTVDTRQVKVQITKLDKN